jgi:hypothetical protein
MHAHRFILILLVAGQYLHAGEVQGSGWLKGPLVEVLADNSVKETDEYGGSLPIGYPAFQKLAIRKGKKMNTWIVSGTIWSTNAGGVVPGAAVYAGYAGGRFRLVAMSNLHGEVLFSLSPMVGAGAKPIVPTHLYVTPDPMMTTILKGAILRRYLLRSTE